MATQETITKATMLLFAAPLANKPDSTAVNATLKVFMATLADIDDGLLVAAVTQHIATSKWFPAVADLRETAVSLIYRADDVPDAYTAWQQVNRALRNYGSWHLAEAEASLHPLALKAINSLGGLVEYGRSDIDDQTSWRARFISAYDTYQRRQSEDAMMLPAVAGYIEARRELNGQSVGGMIAALTGKLSAGK